MALIAKIIIIDDDDAVRDSMIALLECYGYEASGYPSAEEFLAQWGGGADCLLVDHHMPGMTGLDLLEQFRSQGDRTPALMITARVDHAIKARAECIGVRLLQKPVEEDLLISCIEEVRVGI